MARQHVVTEWLLKEFAADSPGGLVLTVLNKRSNTCSTYPPSRFMVEIDSHSEAVEKELSRHESRAKQALITLRAQMEKPPPGVYQLIKPSGHGPEFEFTTRHPTAYLGQMAFIPSGTLNVADDQTIVNLARYLALTYARSSRMRLFREHFHDGMVSSVRRELRNKGIKEPADLDEILSPAELSEMSPLRIMANAENILASMTWWAIRTEADDTMILSDSPVVPTAALGHAIERIHLGQDDALVVVMPLSPRIAVIATRTRALTLSGPHENFGQMVNNCLWPWAERYVISSSEDHLREVEARLPGQRDIDDPSPHAAGAKFGRSFTRSWLIPAIRAKNGTASPRERHIIERRIRRKLPPNAVIAAFATLQVSARKVADNVAPSDS
jgi:hypothetical protein